MFPATTTTASPSPPPPQPPNLSLRPSSLLFSDLSHLPPYSPATLSLHCNLYFTPLLPIAIKAASKSRCFAKPTAEDQLSDSDTRDVAGDIDFEERDSSGDVKVGHFSGDNVSKSNSNSNANANASPPSDFLSLGIPEPVYQV